MPVLPALWAAANDVVSSQLGDVVVGTSATTAIMTLLVLMFRRAEKLSDARAADYAAQRDLSMAECKARILEIHADYAAQIATLRAECAEDVVALNDKVRTLEHVVIMLYEIAPKDRLPGDLWVERLRMEIDQKRNGGNTR